MQLEFILTDFQESAEAALNFFSALHHGDQSLSLPLCTTVGDSDMSLLVLTGEENVLF